MAGLNTRFQLGGGDGNARNAGSYTPGPVRVIEIAVPEAHETVAHEEAEAEPEQLDLPLDDDRGTR